MRCPQCLATLTACLTFLRKVNDILDSDTTVLAVGKMMVRQDTVGTQAVYELPCDAHDASGLSWCDFVLGTHDDYAGACRDIDQHQPNRLFDLGVFNEPFREIMSGRADRWICWVKSDSHCG